MVTENLTDLPLKRKCVFTVILHIVVGQQPIETRVWLASASLVCVCNHGRVPGQHFRYRKRQVRSILTYVRIAHVILQSQLSVLF